MTIAAAPAREANKAHRTELSPVSFLHRSASIYADTVAVAQGTGASVPFHCNGWCFTWAVTEVAACARSRLPPRQVTRH